MGVKTLHLAEKIKVMILKITNIQMMLHVNLLTVTVTCKEPVLLWTIANM